MNSKIIYDLWLSNIPELGIESQNKLLEVFGSSFDLYEAIANKDFLDTIKINGLNQKAIDYAKNRDMSIPQKIEREMERNGIVPLSKYDMEYPETLLCLSDAPLVIYTRGKLSKQEAVAIVGARKASNYGLWVARNIAKKLVEYNFQVVSGMALGIDCAAHQGALEGEGHTTAVLGCGPDICYPQSNSKTFEAIIKKGAVISEFPPGVKPYPFNFPRRNRLISALSRVVVVAEAGLNSGSLITADFALEQGKEVFSVPGNINNIFSLGTNKLIKDGANPLIKIDDIINELGIKTDEKMKAEHLCLGADEKQIYELVLQSGEISVDELSQKSKKTISQIKGIVSILEIKGVLDSALGKIFIA
jgi:DNA processing protein